VLVEEGRKGRICSSSERLWRITQIILSRETAESLRAFAGISEGIENRILQEKERSGSFEDLVSACTTRRYARSRIRRTLLHILLGLTHAANLRFQKSGPQYIRILGYTEEGRKALARMRHTAALPLLSRWSYRKDAAERDLLDFEHRSSILWEALLPSPAFGEIRKEHP
jgi:predicted nucleotidyltransferase